MNSTPADSKAERIVETQSHELIQKIK